MFKTLAFILITLLISVISMAEQNLKLVVGSYNIKNQQNLIGLNDDFKLLTQIDILALQEVSLNFNFEQASTDKLALTSISPSINQTWPYHCEKKVNLISSDMNSSLVNGQSSSSSSQWESQIILSRYPINKCGSFDLNHTGNKERLALWAEVIISENFHILFINTDHETNINLTLGFPDRKLQLESLVTQLSQCQDWLPSDCHQWPVVLTGDFNTNGISITSPIQTLDEINKTISYLKNFGLNHVSPCDDHESTFKSLLGGFQLDHIFVKNLVSDCRLTLKNNKGSDHFPIWTEVH